MSEKIKICHISTVHQTFDDRIFYKQCRTLAANGYEVTLIVQHSHDEVIDKVQIKALPLARTRGQRFLFNSIRAFFMGWRSGARLIHFHDPELIPIGLIFKLFGKKVIFDVHELVYHHLDQKDWLRPVVKKTVKSIYRFFEGLAVRFFNKIILVVDDDYFKEYFLKSYPAFAGKFIFIRNFVLLSLTDSITPAARESERPVLVYAGGLSPIRGILEIIRAIGELPDPPVLLLFGQWSDEDYKIKCMQEKGWPLVKDMGYCRLEEVYAWMKSADLGIAMLYPMTNYMTSLPVKAFEYMACSIPILMSGFPFWIKVFQEGAWFADPHDVDGIRYVLGNILSDKAEMKQKGSAGRQLVTRLYSWESESERLLACYREILD